MIGDAITQSLIQSVEKGGRSCLFFFESELLCHTRADCNTSSPSSSLQQKDLFPAHSTQNHITFYPLLLFDTSSSAAASDVDPTVDQLTPALIRWHRRRRLPLLPALAAPGPACLDWVQPRSSRGTTTEEWGCCSAKNGNRCKACSFLCHTHTLANSLSSLISIVR